MFTGWFGCVGIDLNKIKDCIGDPGADMENSILKAEQDAQVEFPWLFPL